MHKAMPLLVVSIIMMCSDNVKVTIFRSYLWAAVFTFNHYLLISINELLISINELLISINELLISIIHLLISINELLI